MVVVAPVSPATAEYVEASVRVADGTNGLLVRPPWPVAADGGGVGWYQLRQLATDSRDSHVRGFWIRFGVDSASARPVWTASSRRFGLSSPCVYR